MLGLPVCWRKAQASDIAVTLQSAGRPFADVRAESQAVIFLFSRRPSHVDTFDPKPAPSGGQWKTASFWPSPLWNAPRQAICSLPLLLQKIRQSGIESERLFPNVGSCIDDICVIRFHAGGQHQP